MNISGLPECQQGIGIGLSVVICPSSKALEELAVAQKMSVAMSALKFYSNLYEILCFMPLGVTFVIFDLTSSLCQKKCCTCHRVTYSRKM
jgi:hypothetical protein